MAQLLPYAATALLTIGGGIAAKKVLGGTPGKAPSPLPTVTRDTAAATIAADDELRRRKGGAADILTGAGGAEAALTGGKLTLGS